MLPYIRPVIDLRQLVETLQHRSELAQINISRLAQLFDGVVYLARHERHVLYQILRDMNWLDRTILIPDYTCPSVAEAIKRSGNHVLTYRISRPFNIDIACFLDCLRKEPDGILASHVYGEPMPIREIILEHFGDESKRPLLISDMAHARRIESLDPRVNGYDVLLYSLAYYKPMALPDLGVGIVRGRYVHQAVSRSGVDLDDSIVHAMIELAIFCVRKAILGSRLFPLLYRINQGKTAMQIWPPLVSRISSLNVALLAQVIDVPEPDYHWQFSSYDEGLRDINGIQPLPVNHKFASYYPVIVNPHDRDTVRSFCLDRGIFLGIVFSHATTSSQVSNRYSDWLKARILNLPVGPQVTQRDIDRLLTLIREYFSAAKRSVRD